MNIKSFVEVQCNFETKNFLGIGGYLKNIKNEFRNELISRNLINQKYMNNFIIEGEEYFCIQMFTGVFEQVMMAYNFKNINGDLLIFTRRFEKGNAAKVGGALKNIGKNVFSGKSRTWGMETNLLSNTGKLITGLAVPTPVSQQQLRHINYSVNRVNQILLEIVNRYI